MFSPTTFSSQTQYPSLYPPLTFDEADKSNEANSCATEESKEVPPAPVDTPILTKDHLEVYSELLTEVELSGLKQTSKAIYHALTDAFKDRRILQNQELKIIGSCLGLSLQVDSAVPSTSTPLVPVDDAAAAVPIAATPTITENEEQAPVFQGGLIPNYAISTLPLLNPTNLAKVKMHIRSWIFMHLTIAGKPGINNVDKIIENLNTALKEQQFRFLKSVVREAINYYIGTKTDPVTEDRIDALIKAGRCYEALALISLVQVPLVQIPGNRASAAGTEAQNPPVAHNKLKREILPEFLKVNDIELSFAIFIELYPTNYDLLTDVNLIQKMSRPRFLNQVIELSEGIIDPPDFSFVNRRNHFLDALAKSLINEKRFTEAKRTISFISNDFKVVDMTGWGFSGTEGFRNAYGKNPAKVVLLYDIFQLLIAEEKLEDALETLLEMHQIEDSNRIFSWAFNGFVVPRRNSETIDLIAKFAWHINVDNITISLRVYFMQQKDLVGYLTKINWKIIKNPITEPYRYLSMGQKIKERSLENLLIERKIQGKSLEELQQLIKTLFTHPMNFVTILETEASDHRDQMVSIIINCMIAKDRIDDALVLLNHIKGIEIKENFLSCISLWRVKIDPEMHGDALKLIETITDVVKMELALYNLYEHFIENEDAPNAAKVAVMIERNLEYRFKALNETCKLYAKLGDVVSMARTAQLLPIEQRGEATKAFAQHMNFDTIVEMVALASTMADHPIAQLILGGLLQQPKVAADADLESKQS